MSMITQSLCATWPNASAKYVGMKMAKQQDQKVSNVRSQIITMINDICSPMIPNLSNPSGALVDGDLDSLHFASVLMAVEDEFGITIDEDDVEKVSTLNGLIAFVEDKT